MRIQHRGDLTIADTQGMAALTGRRPATIRTVCERGPDGYDHDACSTALDKVKGEVLAMTAPDIARNYGVPVNTIYSRLRRDEIKPIDHDDAGRAMYGMYQFVTRA